MQLVKDFKNYQFIYYWYSKEQGRISPVFPTLVHASEWCHSYHAGNYHGIERRQASAHAAMPDNSHLQRREADQLLKSPIDIAAKKVAKLRRVFQA